MRAVRHPDVSTFAPRVLPFLEANEAENNLMIGIASEPPTEPAIWIEVEDAGRTVGAALCTPPFPLAISRASEPALRAIVAQLAADDVTLPAVLGPAETAATFARLWSEARGVATRVGRHQRIFSCTRVIPPGPVLGSMRNGGERDIDQIAAWAQAFESESGARVGVARTLAEERVRGGRMRLWCTDVPVSMAGFTGGTPSGVRVSFVYTPPEHRGHGYASACVAQLTHELLTTRRFVFLYTDLANPTSNKIYQAIGYQPVCDVDEWRFLTQ